MTKQPDLSRRSFLFGAGAASLVAGAAAAGIGTPKAAEAATAADVFADNEAMTSVFPADETSYIPVKKFKWETLEGPMAFESRTIAASEISRTDECDFCVVGTGISGITAMLRAAANTA